MSQGTTITLRGVEYAVKDPGSPSLAIDVFSNGHSIRSTGAVIALTCPKVARKLKIGTIRDHRYDVMSYGGAAYDAMIAQGCTILEIKTAALVCLDVLGASIPAPPREADPDDPDDAGDPGEVEAEVGFSEATP